MHLMTAVCSTNSDFSPIILTFEPLVHVSPWGVPADDCGGKTLGLHQKPLYGWY